MLKLACALFTSDAATVTAAGTAAGLLRHASAAELPAATAAGVPAAMRFATAVSMTLLRPPPSDMLTTAGRSAGLEATVFETQLTPAATPLVVPLPLLLSTLTACSMTPLCTPVAVPPTVPLQCVPWPLSSAQAQPLDTVHVEMSLTRPRSWLCP